MARLRAAGRSVRQIAAGLDRSPSTVARELRRNGSKTQGYRPSYAQQQASARRWRGSRLDRDPLLREQVLARLRQGWSPQQVAGRFALESGRTVISHETIYCFIYAQLARAKNYNWRHYLPRAKSKRGWRGRKGGSPASFIAHRRPLSQRTEEADDRTSPGHWEADLMLFGNHGQALLVMQKRHSRLLAAVAQAMAGLLAPFPPHWRRTVAFDNGTEFARHYQLHELGVETFFCNVRSPWQKGGVENRIGRLRRFLPRRTDLSALPDLRLAQLAEADNNTPRRCLGYLTPAEIYSNQVLHLKCESTFPLSRERLVGRAVSFETVSKGAGSRYSRKRLVDQHQFGEAGILAAEGFSCLAGMASQPIEGRLPAFA